MSEISQPQINSVTHALTAVRKIDGYAATADIVEQRVRDAFPEVSDWAIRGVVPHRLSEHCALRVQTARAIIRAITDSDPRVDQSAIALISTLVRL